MNNEERETTMVFLEMLGAGVILALIMLGIAKYKDRFNIPAGIQGKTNAEMHTAQGGGLFTCPGGGC